MSAQHVFPALNKKLEGFSNEELQKELSARQAILASWIGRETPDRNSDGPRAHGTAAQSDTAAPASAPARRGARRRKAGARKGGVSTRLTKQAAPAMGKPKKRARRGVSPSGKTTGQYAVEILEKEGGPRTPAFLAPLMKKAGWVTSSPDPAAVVTTTLKKLAAQKKVKKVDGRNEFRAA